jgi:hypothetical protein
VTTKPPAALGMPWPILLAIAVGAMLVVGAIRTDSLLGLPYAAVGAVLAVRRPVHPVGWILFAIGLATVVGTGSWLVAAASVLGLSAGWAGVAALIGGSVAFGLLFLLMVVFPSGRLPGGAWGSLIRAELAAFVVLAVLLAGAAVVTVTDLRGRPISVTNPIGLLPDNASVEAVIAGLAVVMTVLIFVTGTVSMIDRLRQSQGVERQQLKWVIASLALLVVCLALALGTIALVGPTYSNAIWIPATLAYPLPPIAVGVAVLHYRLYDIDRIVNRAIVYGSLTAILAGIFAAATWLTQRFLGELTGPASDATIVLTTLAVATLYAPVRKRLESIVDRYFKYERRQFGAYRDELDRVLSTTEPIRAAQRLASEAQRELNATGVAVVDAGNVPTATAGDWPVTPVLRVAIPGGRGAFDAILVGPKRNGDVHDARAMSELEDIARLGMEVVSLHAGGHGEDRSH